MTSQESIVVLVRASPHLWSQKQREEVLVPLCLEGTVHALRSQLSVWIKCPVSSLLIFHRSYPLTGIFGLTWSEVPCLQECPFLDICIRDYPPRSLGDLCMAELELLCRRKYDRIRHVHQRSGLPKVWLSLSVLEIDYLEVCAVMCLVARQEQTFRNALWNALVCHLREVRHVHHLPRCWLTCEVTRVHQLIILRKTRPSSLIR